MNSRRQYTIAYGQKAPSCDPLTDCGKYGVLRTISELNQSLVNMWVSTILLHRLHNTISDFLETQNNVVIFLYFFFKMQNEGVVDARNIESVIPDDIHPGGGGVLELFFDGVCGPRSETPTHKFSQIETHF